MSSLDTSLKRELSVECSQKSSVMGCTGQLSAPSTLDLDEGFPVRIAEMYRNGTDLCCRSGRGFSAEMAAGTSYLLWDTLSAQSLDVCIRAYRADLLVTCKQAAAELFTGLERRRYARVESLHLRQRERSVLHGLADGLSQEGIAETEGLALRTEQHIETTLRGALNAATRGELASQARELGFGHRSERA